MSGSRARNGNNKCNCTARTGCELWLDKPRKKAQTAPDIRSRYVGLTPRSGFAWLDARNYEGTE